MRGPAILQTRLSTARGKPRAWKPGLQPRNSEGGEFLGLYHLNPSFFLGEDHKEELKHRGANDLLHIEGSNRTPGSLEGRGEGPRAREGALCQALCNIIASQGGGDCAKITGRETEAQTTSLLAELRLKPRNCDSRPMLFCVGDSCFFKNDETLQASKTIYTIV